MSAHRYSTAVHAAFWATAVSFAIALALFAIGWLTGLQVAGFAGAFALAIAAVLAVRWLELAEQEQEP